jgi:hypothetical protein
MPFWKTTANGAFYKFKAFSKIMMRNKFHKWRKNLKMRNKDPIAIGLES